MPNAPGPKGNKPSKQLAAIDQLLIAALKQGPAKKREAINRILELVPDWTRVPVRPNHLPGSAGVSHTRRGMATCSGVCTCRPQRRRVRDGDEAGGGEGSILAEGDSRSD